MPLNSVGDTPFDPRSQRLLLGPGAASELGPALDHLPASRGPNPGLGLHPSSPHVPASCLLDSSGQRLCRLPAKPQEAGCGWRACAPTCLQVLHTPRGFLLLLCVASFLQGAAVNGLVNTVVTSVERRFDLHSYQSGLIASSYDIASCLCLTFVSYFGGQGHKPRWLGWGVLVMGTGSLVFALPHFAVGRYQAQVTEGAEACPADRSTGCADHASGLSGYRLVFMLGQFLHGMGATPLYTLGVTYLDENVKSDHSPIYFGEYRPAQAMTLPGPGTTMRPHVQGLAACGGLWGQSQAARGGGLRGLLPSPEAGVTRCEVSEPAAWAASVHTLCLSLWPQVCGRPSRPPPGLWTAA